MKTFYTVRQKVAPLLTTYQWLAIFLATEFWRDWQLLSLPSDTEKLFVCSALSVPGECCQEAVSATG